MNSPTIAASSLLLLTGLSFAATPLAETRLTAVEVDALQAREAGAGTSGVTGIRTTVLVVDPAQAGPYTIRLSVPANTKIQAHTHRDNRTAIVAAGTWYFGYGRIANSSAERALPVGSFYTEPSGVAHFAETRDAAVVVYISGFGPTDTVYVSRGDPAREH